MIIFTAIGIFVVAWWVTGVLMIAFAPSIYVSKDAPITAKIGAVWAAGWAYPKLFLMLGRLPSMIVAPVEPDAEEEKRIREFQQSVCQCEGCKARRKG